MSNDDLDRTVIMPSPGRRRAATAETTPTQQATPAPIAPQPAVTEANTVSLQMIGSSNKNPLINSATMIFSLAKQLRNTAQHNDVAGLLAHVSGLMQNYEKNCINQGIAPDVAYEARYLLCAFIDEIMLNTPWGHNSVWSHSSLLSTLHNDTSGGERFFQILARKSDAPAQNGPILELIYHCLSLGFQGKFAVQDNGRAALDQITQGVYRTVRDLHGDVVQELSRQWQPATDGRPTVAKLIPWWVVATVLGGLLTMIYVGFYFALNDDSDGVFGEIGKLGREVPQMIQSRTAMAAPLVDPAVSAVNLDQLANNLRNHLINEISAKQLSVEQQAYGLKITIHNNGLFSSGDAVVSETHQNMLAKLANVLADLPGPMIVSGHSDSQKIQTLRFPSNWHLSDERARAVVATLVSAGMQSDRLVPQGKADTVPVASNDTSEGRQQNRRIEIFIRSY